MVGGEEETDYFSPYKACQMAISARGEKMNILFTFGFLFDLFNLFVMFESFSSFIVSASCFYICFLTSLS